MLKRIIELEKLIDKKENSIDSILKKGKIKGLISEICNEQQWSEIQTSNIESTQIYFDFMSRGNNISVYRNIYSICYKMGYNLSDIIYEVNSMCTEQRIPLGRDEIKKFICCACICGFLSIESTQRLDIEDLEDLEDFQTETAIVYIIENILCGNDNSVLSDVDIVVQINSMSDFWMEFMLYTIAKTQDYIKVVQLYQERLESEDSIKKNIDEGISKINSIEQEAEKKISDSLEEKFKEHVQGFYGKTMEIIGVFIAVFSLIGFNLFRDKDMSVYSVLILNLSCILGIVTMFFLIDQIMSKKMKSAYYICIIVVLVAGILLMTNIFSKIGFLFC